MAGETQIVMDGADHFERRPYWLFPLLKDAVSL